MNAYMSDARKKKSLFINTVILLLTHIYKCAESVLGFTSITMKKLPQVLKRWILILPQNVPSWCLVWLLLLFVVIRYFDTTKEFSSFTHIKKYWITELKFGLFSTKLYKCKFFLKMLPIYWKILITHYINHTYIFIALLVYSLLV